MFEPGAFRKLIRDGRTGDIIPLTPPKTVPHVVDDESVALASGHDPMAYLATPAGLLFNELCRSPATVCAAVEAMLEFIVASDVGAWKKQHGSLALFVLRLAVRIEEFALFILWNHAWRKQSETETVRGSSMGGGSGSSSSARGRFDPLAGAAADAENVGAMPSIMGAWGTAIRGVRCRDEAADTLRAWQVRVRERLDAEVFPMVERWCTVATREKKARRACVLWAHLAYIYKATRDPTEDPALGKGAARLPGPVLDFRSASTLLCAQVFLTSRFDYGVEAVVGDFLPRTTEATHAAAQGRKRKKLSKAERAAEEAERMRALRREAELGIPQTELFDVWQRQRRALIEWMRRPSNSAMGNEVIEAVVRVTTLKGPRARPPNAIAPLEWSDMSWRAGWSGCFMPETEARFARANLAAADRDAVSLMYR